MKVIFLDIDGVMNSNIFYEKRYKKRWFKLSTYAWKIKRYFKYVFNGFKHKPNLLNLSNYTPPNTFEYMFKRLKKETDKEKWVWLSEFCNEHDYKICISSVWKRHFHNDCETNLEWWNKALIELGFKDGIFIGITGDRRTLRGQEIKEFIDSFQNDIEMYAILDDDSDMLPEQLHTNYFQVDGYFGLSPNHLYRINRYFTKCG